MALVPTAGALLLLSAWAAYGQADKPLSFDVASVKSASAPITTKDDYTAGYNAGMRSALASFGMRFSGQRVTVTDNTLRDLVRMAYQVKDSQIIAPAWTADEKYEIAATMPEGATRAQAPEMLRTLLEQRFHLKAHRETREMAAFVLLQGPKGAKLTPPTRGGGGVSNDGRLAAINCPMDRFAELLAKAAGAPVVDQTGITGNFDFDLRFRPALGGADDRPSLEQALAEIGLKMEKRKMPIDVLVIDSADKVPTEN
jgi:uncharacterized protein (TIGR03435 family)